VKQIVAPAGLAVKQAVEPAGLTSLRGIPKTRSPLLAFENPALSLVLLGLDTSRVEKAASLGDVSSSPPPW
jgi:hypothetical protein